MMLQRRRKPAQLQQVMDAQETWLSSALTSGSLSSQKFKLLTLVQIWTNKNISKTPSNYIYLPDRQNNAQRLPQQGKRLEVKYIMRRLAPYTCQRCLNSVTRSPRTSQCASLSTQLTLGRRNLFAGPNGSPRHDNTIQLKAQSFQQFPGRRAASSLGSQRAPELKSTTEPKIESTLKPNNLFHPFSASPSAEMRRRAAFIMQHAYCPHPDHRQTRMPTNPEDPEGRKSPTGPMPPKHVSFECPDCGIPVACSEEHWADDYESHLEICDTLREINEDDHDLRSGRFFPEFEYSGPQIEEAMVNMTNWDTFLYSREFQAINDERSLRQATRLLTYPVTIGSVLHELSPYNIRKGGRLTVEGLKSLSGMSSELV
jgi:splicing suppressor protein 51